MTATLPKANWSALAARTMQRCDDLARDSEEENRLTRRFCTPALAAAHRRVQRWFDAAHLHSRVDAAANIIGSTADPEKSFADTGRQRLLLGSHLDTVPGAGRYDGILGVLIALAVVESLEGVEFPFDLEVVGFSDEEGTRYRSPYLGSRAIAGTFDMSLLSRADKDGIKLATALQVFGCDPNDLSSAAYNPDAILGFIESHIEQGPLLEAEENPIGLVTAFAGQTRMLGRFVGKTGHAGTVPMTMRSDAGLAASRFHVAMNDFTLSVDGLRATMGFLHFAPGASNVISGRADFNIEIRHADDDVRSEAAEKIIETGHEVAEKSGTTFEIIEREEQPAVLTDDRLCKALAASIKRAGHTVRNMVSGAGHDSVVMAGLTPTATLFLRNPGGISHHPDEQVDEQDVAVAIEILARMVCELAQA